MIKRIALPALTFGFVVFNATIGISQTAPGTYANPIKGGATLLQFSRSAVNATLTGGKVVYYQCGAQETQMSVTRTLSAGLASTACDEVVDLKASLTGQWNQWIRVTPGSNGAKYQGLHAATLSLVDSGTGGIIATLDCRGSNGVGTHRSPLAEVAESCAQLLHFEGTFTGRIVGGTYKGGYIQGTYAGDFSVDPVQAEQGQPISMTLEGVVLRPCPQRFTPGAAPTLAQALTNLHLGAAK